MFDSAAFFKKKPPSNEFLGTKFQTASVQVKNARPLMVSRKKFLHCLQIRKQVCETFQNAEIDQRAVSDLPEQGVPQPFVDHAVHIAAIEGLRTCMEGPASRQSVDAGNSQMDNIDPQEESDEEHDETPSGLENGNQASEDMIGLDYGADPPAAQLFEKMKSKFEQLTHEARKVAAASDKGAINPVAAGSHEHCRRLVVDLHHLSKKLVQGR